MASDAVAGSVIYLPVPVRSTSWISSDQPVDGIDTPSGQGM